MRRSMQGRDSEDEAGVADDRMRLKTAVQQALERFVEELVAAGHVAKAQENPLRVKLLECREEVLREVDDACGLQDGLRQSVERAERRLEFAVKQLGARAHAATEERTRHLKEIITLRDHIRVQRETLKVISGARDADERRRGVPVLVEAALGAVRAASPPAADAGGTPPRRAARGLASQRIAERSEQAYNALTQSLSAGTTLSLTPGTQAVGTPSPGRQPLRVRNLSPEHRQMWEASVDETVGSPGGRAHALGDAARRAIRRVDEQATREADHVFASNIAVLDGDLDGARGSAVTFGCADEVYDGEAATATPPAGAVRTIHSAVRAAMKTMSVETAEVLSLGGDSEGASPPPTPPHHAASQPRLLKPANAAEERAAREALSFRIRSAASQHHLKRLQTMEWRHVQEVDTLQAEVAQLQGKLEAERKVRLDATKPAGKNGGRRRHRQRVTADFKRSVHEQEAGREAQVMAHEDMRSALSHAQREREDERLALQHEIEWLRDLQLGSPLASPRSAGSADSAISPTASLRKVQHAMLAVKSAKHAGARRASRTADQGVQCSGSRHPSEGDVVMRRRDSLIGGYVPDGADGATRRGSAESLDDEGRLARAMDELFCRPGAAEGEADASAAAGKPGAKKGAAAGKAKPGGGKAGADPKRKGAQPLAAAVQQGSGAEDGRALPVVTEWQVKEVVEVEVARREANLRGRLREQAAMLQRKAEAHTAAAALEKTRLEQEVRRLEQNARQHAERERILSKRCAELEAEAEAQRRAARGAAPLAPFPGFNLAGLATFPDNALHRGVLATAEENARLKLELEHAPSIVDLVKDLVSRPPPPRPVEPVSLTPLTPTATPTPASGPAMPADPASPPQPFEDEAIAAATAAASQDPLLKRGTSAVSVVARPRAQSGAGRRRSVSIAQPDPRTRGRPSEGAAKPHARSRSRGASLGSAGSSHPRTPRRAPSSAASSATHASNGAEEPASPAFPAPDPAPRGSVLVPDSVDAWAPEESGSVASSDHPRQSVLGVAAHDAVDAGSDGAEGAPASPAPRGGKPVRGKRGQTPPSRTKSGGRLGRPRAKSPSLRPAAAEAASPARRPGSAGGASRASSRDGAASPPATPPLVTEADAAAAAEVTGAAPPMEKKEDPPGPEATAGGGGSSSPRREPEDPAPQDRRAPPRNEPTPGMHDVLQATPPVATSPPPAGKKHTPRTPAAAEARKPAEEPPRPEAKRPQEAQPRLSAASVNVVKLGLGDEFAPPPRTAGRTPPSLGVEVPGAEAPADDDGGGGGGGGSAAIPPGAVAPVEKRLRFMDVASGQLDDLQVLRTAPGGPCGAGLRHAPPSRPHQNTLRCDSAEPPPAKRVVVPIKVDKVDADTEFKLQEALHAVTHHPDTWHFVMPAAEAGGKDRRVAVRRKDLWRVAAGGGIHVQHRARQVVTHGVEPQRFRHSVGCQTDPVHVTALGMEGEVPVQAAAQAADSCDAPLVSLEAAVEAAPLSTPRDWGYGACGTPTYCTTPTPYDQLPNASPRRAEGQAWGGARAPTPTTIRMELDTTVPGGGDWCRGVSYCKSLSDKLAAQALSPTPPAAACAPPPAGGRRSPFMANLELEELQRPAARGAAPRNRQSVARRASALYKTCHRQLHDPVGV